MSTNESPSDETNQEKPNEDALLDAAMREHDTLPPSASGNANWLEQFRLYGQDALAELEQVAAHGLEELEIDALVWAAAKLIKAAAQHEPNALQRVIALVEIS